MNGEVHEASLSCTSRTRRGAAVGYREGFFVRHLLELAQTDLVDDADVYRLVVQTTAAIQDGTSSGEATEGLKGDACGTLFEKRYNSVSVQRPAVAKNDGQAGSASSAGLAKDFVQ